MPCDKLVPIEAGIVNEAVERINSGEDYAAEAGGLTDIQALQMLEQLRAYARVRLDETVVRNLEKTSAYIEDTMGAVAT